MTEKLNDFAVDILTCSTLTLSTLSLNDLPSGWDMSSTSLTLSFWQMARMQLDLKAGSGGVSNGPHTKPTLCQEAKVSVTWRPFLAADPELATFAGGSTTFWKALAPSSKSFTTL